MRFKTPKGPRKPSRFWTTFIGLVFAIIALRLFFSLIAATYVASRNAWRVLFRHLPLLANVPDTFLEGLLATALTMMLLTIATFAIIAYRARGANALLKRLDAFRRYQPVFVPDFLCRYEFGFILGPQRFSCAREGERGHEVLYSIFVPAYPLPLTGKVIEAYPSYLLYVHNPFEEIATYLATGRHYTVSWDLTDAAGNRIDATMIAILPVSGNDSWVEKLKRILGDDGENDTS
jgi:hypothetical protein